MSKDNKDIDSLETQEWIEAIDSVIKNAGPKRASFILTELAKKLTETGEVPTYNLTTPFRNTIPSNEEAAMPGDLFMERRIRSLIRWNARFVILSSSLAHA